MLVRFLSTVILATVTVSTLDMDYENFHHWTCQLNYHVPREFEFSFGFCFKEPSKYCRQHTIAMNGCKKHKNMGLFCCVMENVEENRIYKIPPWFSRSMFVYITSPIERMQRMFEFFASDITHGNITSPEEMAAFLSIVMLDTNFLLNMEEHLPTDIAANIEQHKHKEHVKYVGRGAIQVKGKPFYAWISKQLNKQLREENNTTTVMMNAIESPEILLFPTVAFRAAATIWRYSYSYVEGESLGELYKKFSTGGIEGLASILYNLKGNIQQLRELYHLWIRIRKVLKCNVNDTLLVAEITPSYETICRGLPIDMINMDTKTLPVLCKVCPRRVHVFFLIHPEIIDSTEKRDKIINLFEDIFAVNHNSKLTIVYMTSSQEFRKKEFHRVGYNLPDFLSNMHQHYDLPALLNETIKFMESFGTERLDEKDEKKDRSKYIISIISNTVRTLVQNNITGPTFNDSSRKMRIPFNFYPLYFTPEVTLQTELPLIIRNKLYNIESKWIVEAFCNDPEIITPAKNKIFTLRKAEKRSFVLQIPDDHRKFDLNMINRKGNVSILHLRKQIWEMPFDESIPFNLKHNVRSELNIHDNHSRFKGEDVEITIRRFPQDHVQVYKPTSLEIFLEFQGKNMGENEILISFDEDPNIGMMDKQKNEKSMAYLEFFKMSCIFAGCLLFICMLAFIPHSLQLLIKIKNEIKSMRAKRRNLRKISELKTNLEISSLCMSSCKDCREEIHTDAAYNRLYYRENGIQGNNKSGGKSSCVRKNSFLVFPGENLARCKHCNNRNDVLLITVVHFFRILFLMLFEMTLLSSIHLQHRQTECSISSGIMTLSVNMMLMLCLTEMLCYCGMKVLARNKAWWIFLFSYCIIVSVATEQTREKKQRASCWPTDDHIEGRMVLASVILLALLLLLVCIYYCQMERNNKARKVGHSFCLVVICLFFVADVILLEMVVNNVTSALFAFIIVNIIMMLIVFLFTIAVQVKVQNWFKGLRGSLQSTPPVTFQDNEQLISDSVESSKQNSPTKTNAPSESLKKDCSQKPNLQQCFNRVSFVPAHIRAFSDTIPADSRSAVNCTVESVSHCSDGEVPRPSLTLNGCSEDALELIMRARQRRSHSELLCGSELLIPNRLNHVQHYHSDHLHPQSSVGCEMKKQNLRYTRSCNNNIPIITLRTDDSDEKTET